MGMLITASETEKCNLHQGLVFEFMGSYLMLCPAFILKTIPLSVSFLSPHKYRKTWETFAWQTLPLQNHHYKHNIFAVFHEDAEHQGHKTLAFTRQLVVNQVCVCHYVFRMRYHCRGNLTYSIKYTSSGQEKKGAHSTSYFLASLFCLFVF